MLGTEMANYIVAKKMSTIALTGGRAFLCLLALPKPQSPKCAPHKQKKSHVQSEGVGTGRQIAPSPSICDSS